MESPRPALLDTHVHLWNLDSSTLSYDWLRPGIEYPVLGRLDRLRTPLYDANAFEAEARFGHLCGVILVEAEAAAHEEDPVDETRWFAAEAASAGWTAGIVAHADLGSDDVGDQLARHVEAGPVRGIRDFTNAARLQQPDFLRGYSKLAHFELVYDLDARWDHLSAARALAEAAPDVTLVVEHLAFPEERTDQYFDHWSVAMREVAGAPNVVCKISGLGMGDPRWTPDSMRPWVEHAISCFGAQRCMLGSNWPVDRMYSSYDALLHSYDVLTRHLTPSEREAVFNGTAQRVYRLTAR